MILVIDFALMAMVHCYQMLFYIYLCTVFFSFVATFFPDFSTLDFFFSFPSFSPSIFRFFSPRKGNSYSIPISLIFSFLFTLLSSSFLTRSSHFSFVLFPSTLSLLILPQGIFLKTLLAPFQTFSSSTSTTLHTILCG